MGARREARKHRALMHFPSTTVQVNERNEAPGKENLTVSVTPPNGSRHETIYRVFL
jgi:hypothetical protein